MRIDAKDREKFLKLAIKRGLVLGVYDIETSHMEVRTFYIGQKVSISHKQIIKPSKVISIQYLSTPMKKAKYLQWDNIGKLDHDDSSMLEEFVTNILPKMDLVVTQNGDNFDKKVLNDRLMLQKLPLFTSKPSIDILKLSRKSFRAPSHKLDYRSSIHGFGGKIHMIDEDWVDVETNRKPVSAKMGPYGCKDVEDTLNLFWAELPYYKDLPADVEKTILKFLPPEVSKENKKIGPKCPKCKKYKHKYMDVKVIKGKIHCNNCKGIF